MVLCLGSAEELEEETWLRAVDADLHSFNLGLASAYRHARSRTA